MFNVDTRNINRIKWLSLIIGVLLIIGSFFYLSDPLGSTMGLVIGIGGIFIIMSILKFIRYITNELFRRAGFLIGAIVDLVFGIFIIYNKSASFIAFTSLIAFWVLFKGILNIANSFDMKKLGVDKWWLQLIAGIIGIIAGSLLMNNFSLSITYITIIISFSMFYNGIISVITFFTLDKVVHKIKLKRDFKNDNNIEE